MNANETINVDEVYESRFLRGAEIPGGGWLVTINNVYQEELRGYNGQPKMKIILGLSELDKEMALNRTQARALSDFYGPDALQWIGKRVAISPEKLKTGQITIRFARGQPQTPAQPKRAPAPATPQPPEEPPAPPVDELQPPPAEEGETESPM